MANSPGLGTEVVCRGIDISHAANSMAGGVGKEVGVLRIIATTNTESA